MEPITLEQLQKILPGNPRLSEWLPAVNSVLPEYEINTVKRLAAFFSQTGHESNDWRILEENLNYSVQGLLKIFPKYFDAPTATQYQRIPKKIASRVYANRMGNGNEASMDGWKYRGRGIIQITGFNNYKMLDDQMYEGRGELLKNPDLLLLPEYALESACVWWKNNGCNKIADTGDVVAMTKKINGGTHGLEDRQERYIVALGALA